MGYMQLLLTCTKLVIKIVSIWFEKDKEKKKIKQEALNEVKEGIRNRDASKITAGFDRLNKTKKGS